MAHETSVKAVLVPLDGSPVSEQAIPVGAGAARRAGATLHLAMAYEPPSALALSFELPEVGAELDREGRARSAEYLEARAEAARGSSGLPVTTALLEGPPAAAVAEYAETHGIGLIVMTTHGRSGLSRWWLGSVTDRLLRRTTVPVLLLHPRKRAHRTEFRGILVALSGERDEMVLDAALALGRPGPKVRYLLARVVPPTAPIISPLPSYPRHQRPTWAARQAVQAGAELARLAAPL